MVRVDRVPVAGIPEFGDPAVRVLNLCRWMLPDGAFAGDPESVLAGFFGKVVDHPLVHLVGALGRCLLRRRLPLGGFAGALGRFLQRLIDRRDLAPGDLLRLADGGVDIRGISGIRRSQRLQALLRLRQLAVDLGDTVGWIGRQLIERLVQLAALCGQRVGAALGLGAALACFGAGAFLPGGFRFCLADAAQRRQLLFQHRHPLPLLVEGEALAQHRRARSARFHPGELVAGLCQLCRCRRDPLADRIVFD